MNNKDQKFSDQITELIGELLEAAKTDRLNGRKYTRARGFLEKGLRQISAGYRRELQRPTSIGLPVHELKKEEEPTKHEPQGDLLADNLPDVEDDEMPKPVRKTSKKKAE